MLLVMFRVIPKVRNIKIVSVQIYLKFGKCLSHEILHCIYLLFFLNLKLETVTTF